MNRKVKSFSQYASNWVIIKIIAKERAKYVKKNQSGKSRDNDKLWLQLTDVMPRRSEWVTISKNNRNQCRNTSIDAKRKIAQCSILYTIKKHYASKSQHAYLTRLERFCDEVRRTATSGSITLQTPEIAAIFKKMDDSGPIVKATFRPTCVYTDLATKVLIKLASDYLARYLDCKLHDDILAYRLPRIYNGKSNYMTTRQDAVDNITAFREKHKHETIWVSECDIQKFFDIVNHDVAMSCFNELINKHYSNDSRQAMQPAINILDAFFKSYSFKRNVGCKNDDDAYWEKALNGEKRRNMKLRKATQDKEVKCCFAYVDEDAFKSVGGYTDETLDFNKIGIPQGGALSTLVANVMLNSVDQCIVDKHDDRCLFNRFGDDIILMHTDGQKCLEHITAYMDSLTQHHLVYHAMENVEQYKKEQGHGITKDFWDVKSKHPYAWTRGPGNSAEWLGFLGYEIASDGSMRLRKSSFQKKFTKMCSEYNKLKVQISYELDNSPEVGTSLVSNLHEHCINRFNKVVTSIMNDRSITRNKHMLKQMHYLDEYRHRKLNKLMKELYVITRVDSMKLRRSMSFASLLGNNKKQ